jgi:hypothetical protein
MQKPKDYHHIRCFLIGKLALHEILLYLYGIVVWQIEVLNQVTLGQKFAF